MARTKLDSFVEDLKRPEIPEPLYLKELFQRYAKAYGLTYVDIGAAIGCSAANVCQQLNRATERWTVSQIKSFCEALHVPISEAVAAAQFERRREK